MACISCDREAGSRRQWQALPWTWQGVFVGAARAFDRRGRALPSFCRNSQGALVGGPSQLHPLYLPLPGFAVKRAAPLQISHMYHENITIWRRERFPAFYIIECVINIIERKLTNAETGCAV